MSALTCSLPGVAGVDHFFKPTTCLRCKQTASHVLTCPLQYKYPTALVLDTKGFCLQARFNSQPPKPSNYGLEPYTYYPIRGMVAYQFQQQPGKIGRNQYLHKIELQAPTLQCPLASLTPVYGHDYTLSQGNQGKRLHPLEEVSSPLPESSEDEAAENPGGPQKVESGATRESGESSEDLCSLQEQPFDGDAPLFPKTPVRRTVPRETERKSPSSLEQLAREVSKEHTE